MKDEATPEPAPRDEGSGPHNADNRDLRLLRARDPAAVQRWFRRHADALYTFVFYRVAKDRECAADVVSDTFVTALEKIDHFDEARGTMRTWLTYIARNCIRAALRQHARYRVHAEVWEAVDRRLLATYRQLAESPLPDELVQKQETRELVHMALTHLPETYRELLTLHYCHGRAVKDIADSRAVSESAVKSLLHRARLAFKSAFLTIAESFAGENASGEVFP